MSGVQAVVFDVGRVLIEWDPEGFYDRAIGPERRAALFAEVDLHGANLAIDNGAPWAGTIAALAARHPAWAEEIGWWHSRWFEMASPAIAHSVRLLAALQARGIPCYALTNFGSETWDFALTRHPFLASFDGAAVSGKLRAMKPGPAIYAEVERLSGLAGPALLFTDDKAENIAAAAARGWRTHLFEGPEGLAARLEAEGLLTGAEAA